MVTNYEKIKNMTVEDELEFCKQVLKRKEQECERLKQERDTWHYQWEKRYEMCESLSDVIDELREQLDQLKADNKHLNDLLNQALKELEEMRELKDTESLQACILTRENERLKELLAQDQCFQNKSHKCVKSFYIDERYKQAIEKIKEIATKMEYGNDFEYDFAWGEQIIKICDEVNDV